MASKAELLPSGSYRSRGCVYVNGKKKYKSFTVDPEKVGGATRAKRECVRNAEDWEDSYNDNLTAGVSVLNAIDKYISDRENVLSPSTVKSYEQVKQYFAPLFEKDALEVRSEDIQPIVNELAVSVKGKTIRNRISLLLSALEYVGNDRKFKLRYPQVVKAKTQSPENEDVRRLLRDADEELKLAICLAAFTTLRRSEVCGLKYEDILRDLKKVSVHRACVIGKDKKFHYKDMPKNANSVRTVDLPPEVLAIIPEGDPSEYIIKSNPDAITKRFVRLRNRLGLKCRYHDLRHFAATFRSEIKIPSKYIEADGGWGNESKILQSVYDNVLESSRKKYSKQVNEYIADNFHDVI